MNNWKKTLGKVGRSSVIVIVAGLIAVWQNNPKYFYLIPILVGVLDYLKHKK